MSEVKNVLAKFYVAGVSDITNGNETAPEKTGENVTLSAVTSGSEENKSFSMWTPTGQLTMAVTNPNLYGFFVQGEELYLNISKTNPAAEAAPEAAAPAEGGE